MALQPRIIACGNTIATFAMGVRFLVGPAVMAAASMAVGLRGSLLHVAIVQVKEAKENSTSLFACLFVFPNTNYSLNIQAALPQGIVPFVFAKEYNVHPDILSTAYVPTSNFESGSFKLLQHIINLHFLFFNFVAGSYLGC